MTAQPLTIALIVNLYPPYIVGGNEILARDVTEGLRQRGHTVHVLTGQGSQLPQDGFTHSALDIDLARKADIFLGGLPLTIGRVVRWHLYNQQSYQGIRRALAQLRPDLVIAWNLYMASAAPLIAARHAGFPLIAHPADKWLLYSLHDLGQLVPANNRKQRVALTLLKRVIQPPLRRLGRPDYILAVSQFIRRLHLQAGYAPAQSCATYLGVHTDRFTYQAHPFPGQRRWRLIFAGQLWAGKGPQVAIAALHRLRQHADLPEVELAIYGGGTQGFIDHLQKLIGEYSLQEQVFLRGFAAQPALAQAFHSHDLFLFCSLWDEPFSGGLLEALGSGLPTVATTAGGTPEAVQHEVNGLVVPPDDPAALADAIARYMREPALYERVGAQAAQEVQAKWGFDAYLDRLEVVYRAIVAGHRPGAPVAIDQLVKL